jgi:hypothetical protein
MMLVAIGLAGAVFVIAGSGAVDLTSWLLGMLLMLAGFIGLGVARRAWAPLRPMRIALGIAVVAASALLLALPWPPRRSDLGSFITLALGLVLSFTTSLVGTRFRRIAFGMLCILGCGGIFMLAHFGHSLVSGSGAAQWANAGPAQAFALVLADSIPIAWIAACWHARSLWPTNMHMPRAT